MNNNPNPNLHGLQAYWKQKAMLKARRLAKNKPKWKDEHYMNKEQYEAYIDKYLALEEDQERPFLDQAKIAKDMYKEKVRQDESSSDEATIEAIIQEAKNYAKYLKQAADSSDDATNLPDISD